MGVAHSILFCTLLQNDPIVFNCSILCPAVPSEDISIPDCILVR